MSINNLHSLLGGKWFIEKAYANSLMPALVSILNGNTIAVNKKEDTEYSKKTLTTNKNISSNSNNSNDDYVLIVSFKNPIYKYNQECGPRGTKSKQSLIASYENDVHCKGIVLDIDSGGGQASGTPEFHDFLKNYSKPIVAYTDGLMCSAAYYIACGASHIIANKRADAIGSIGTMISFLDMTGYYEKKGAKLINEYATKSTEKNKDFEELLKGNPEGYIKNQLDPITDVFHEDVKNSRKKLKEEVLKGGIYSPDTSLELGLIDEIGTIQTAINKVFELSKANTNNTNTMSKEIKAPSIANALGYDSPFSSNENGVFLSVEDFSTVENALTVANNAVEDANSERDTINQSVEEATTSIDNALTTAAIEFTPEMSLTEKINLLEDQRKEYASKTGGGKTSVVTTDADETPEGDEEQKVYAHDEEAKKILGIN